ncbi:MAG: hypothetical protein ACREHG_00405, partial [Candidatus Saccharimonadales bacterium]
MTFDPHNPFPKPPYVPGGVQKPAAGSNDIFSLNRGQGPTQKQLLADVKKHYEKYYNSAFSNVTSTEHRMEAMKHLEE